MRRNQSGDSTQCSVCACVSWTWSINADVVSHQGTWSESASRKSATTKKPEKCSSSQLKQYVFSSAVRSSGVLRSVSGLTVCVSLQEKFWANYLGELEKEQMSYFVQQRVPKPFGIIQQILAWRNLISAQSAFQTTFLLELLRVQMHSDVSIIT